MGRWSIRGRRLGRVPSDGWQAQRSSASPTDFYVGRGCPPAVSARCRRWKRASLEATKGSDRTVTKAYVSMDQFKVGRHRTHLARVIPVLAFAPQTPSRLAAFESDRSDGLGEPNLLQARPPHLGSGRRRLPIRPPARVPKMPCPKLSRETAASHCPRGSRCDNRTGSARAEDVQTRSSARRTKRRHLRLLRMAPMSAMRSRTQALEQFARTQTLTRAPRLTTVLCG